MDQQTMTSQELIEVINHLNTRTSDILKKLDKTIAIIKERQHENDEG